LKAAGIGWERPGSIGKHEDIGALFPTNREPTIVTGMTNNQSGAQRVSKKPPLRRASIRISDQKKKV